MNIITGKLMPDEGKIEWSKNVRVGYLDQHAVLEKGQTIRDVLQSAFAFLFDLEAQMNGYYTEMAEAAEALLVFGHALRKVGGVHLANGNQINILHGVPQNSM